MTRRSGASAEPVALARVAAMREAYRAEMNAQIVHDSHHARGFTQLWRLTLDGAEAGYGAVGDYDTQRAEVIKECWIVQELRGSAFALFQALIEESGATRVEAQTNDRLLTLMLLDRGRDIVADRYLFADAVTTSLAAPDVVFRERREGDRLFEHHGEPEGDWVLEREGEIVASGGLLGHYNPPYEDLYMEVAETHRRRGYGAYLIQELKRTCRERGKIPAARCGADNLASRRTLERAGMFPCARILRATLLMG